MGMASLKRPAIIAVIGAMLLGAALFAWQREQTAARGGFASLDALRAAYARVTPGMPVARLTGLGFDRARPGAQTLSYLGTIEFFMPKNSGEFDRLDPAICPAWRRRTAAAPMCSAWAAPGPDCSTWPPMRRRRAMDGLCFW